MDIKQVDGFETEVPARALNLIFQIRRRHAMHPAGQLLGIEYTGLDVLAVEVGARVWRWITVEREVAGLGADQNFIAMQLRGFNQSPERDPDISFRALMPVVDGTIQNIDAGVKTGLNRRGVGLIGGVAGVAQISSQSN